jgi:hypothetical protein
MRLARFVGCPREGCRLNNSSLNQSPRGISAVTAIEVMTAATIERTNLVVESSGRDDIADKLTAAFCGLLGAQI